MTSVWIPIEGEASTTAALSQAEMWAIIQMLGDADKLRLKKSANVYAKLTGFDPDDLWQEASLRVLDRRRQWPRGKPVLKFFRGVMRSIAWEWKRKLHEELDDNVRDPRCGESSMNASIDAAKIVQMFDDDPVAQKIVLGMMEGTRGEELQRLSELSKVDYETKRRKIRRRIEKLLADE